MNTMPNLKEIERRAFRATYQDGLLDIYIAIVVASMALMLSVPDTDAFPVVTLLLAFLGVGAGALILWAGKKYVTLPRMGQAEFGPARRARARRLSLAMAGIIILQILLVLLPTLALTVPSLGAAVARWFPDRSAERLLVAVVAALFVGPSSMLVAYFRDFPRGYYIALLISLGVFLAIWLEQPAHMAIAAGLVALPGLFLFIRFVRGTPRVPREDR